MTIKLVQNFLRLLTILLLGHVSVSSAQLRFAGTFDARTWSAEQGLSAGQISSIAQGTDGYLWLGTERGLLRFDGFSFQPIPLSGTAAHSGVQEVLVDHEGTVWVRTREAKLLRVRSGMRAEMDTSIPQEFEIIPAITPAFEAGLLVASAARGLVRLHADQVEDFHSKGPDLIVSLAQTSRSIVWLGTRGQGLYRWTPGGSSQVPGTIGTSQITSLLPAPNGQLWIGTDQGLYTLDESKPYIDKPIPGSEHLQVLALAKDHDGSVWAGTSTGLLRISSAKAEWIQHTALAVTALVADREGDIWFGDGQKLVRLRQPPVLTYQLPASVAKKGVGALATDSHGRIWFAGLDGGLYWKDGSAPHRVSIAGLDSDTVYSIDCLGGDVWLGRRNGGLTRLRFDGDRIAAQTWTTKDGLVQNSIVAVKAMRDGSVWAGSLTKGLSHLENGHFHNWDTSSIGSNSVTAIDSVADDSVFVATPTGLAEFSSGSWHQIGTNHSSAEILSLHAIQNSLLVGTEQGISYFDRKERSIKSLDANALHEPVLGMALQGDKLWVSTTGQLFSGIYANTTKPSLSGIRSYGATDGLVNSQGVRRTRTVVKDGAGNVYVATYAGLSVIMPREKQAPVPALAHVSSVQADEAPLSIADKVFIPAGTRRTTLSFNGLDFSAPEQIRLRYKLDGFDQTWNEATISRQATYTNLRPGPYTFRVVAQNDQGDWIAQGASLPIEVEPTLLQRTSVRIGILALLLFLGAWIYRARIQFVIGRANALAEERVLERTRIARELHDTLLQGFISVLMHLHVMSERSPERSDTRQELRPVLDMMEQVIEEGRLAVQGLRSTDGDVTDLESCFASPKEIHDPASTAKYQFSVRGKARAIHPVICEEVGRIGKEAVSNAFRHANAKEISVSLIYSRASLDLRIQDDGIGIDADVLSQGKDGHWGLLGMRERAKHIGARLEIISRAPRGCVVSVTVPARIAFRG